MFKVMIYFIISLIISGCAGSSYHYDNEIGADFKPYVANFKSYYDGPWPRGLVVKFSEETVGSWADCTPIGSQYLQKTIRINSESWPTLGPEQRRSTIFHELGHCILGLPHLDYSLTYMMPAMRSEGFYVLNKKILTDDLFK